MHNRIHHNVLCYRMLQNVYLLYNVYETRAVDKSLCSREFVGAGITKRLGDASSYQRIGTSGLVISAISVISNISNIS